MLREPMNQKAADDSAVATPSDANAHAGREDAARLEPNPLDELERTFQRAHDHAATYVFARVGRVKISVRTAIIRISLVAFAAMLCTSAVIVGTVLLLIGLSGVASSVLGIPLWLAYVVVGLCAVLLPILAIRVR